jgi:hypothetical protein
MKRILSLSALVSVAILLAGCEKTQKDQAAPESNTAAGEAGSHQHADGTTHDDPAGEHAEGEDHAHDEVPLGKAKIGEIEVELAQGHGKVEAGKEGHLVVKLPHNDKGATVVRAWIGTDDRTLSFVGKGEYAASHDDYDVHATAPDPLPDNVMWWIEIEKPDGAKLVGSARPLME